MKNLDIAEQDRKAFINRKKRSNMFIKTLLLVTIVYFGLHAISALADVVRMPDGTIINCTPTSIGTIVCL